MTSARMKSVILSVFCLLTFNAMTAAAVKCYYCTGSTSSPGWLDNGCGVPFNATAPEVNQVTCEGVCVTEVMYNGGKDEISRSCSIAQPSSGCEKTVTTSGNQVWSCIDVCSTDLCNTQSMGTAVQQSLTVLVLAALATKLFV